jgi:hypothetical protein
MRKHISFSMAAAIMALAMVFSAKSSVVAAHVDVVRPKVGSYVAMSSSYLPIQVLEEAY